MEITQHVPGPDDMIRRLEQINESVSFALDERAMKLDRRPTPPPIDMGSLSDLRGDDFHVGRDGRLRLSDVDDDARIHDIVGDSFYAGLDLNAIQRAALEAQRNGGQFADKDHGLYVGQQGEVMLGSEVGDPSRVSDVVGDTFYAGLDLNAIQTAALEAQRNGGQFADKDHGLYVGQQGEVMLGGEVGDSSRVSEVVGDTFYVRDTLEEDRVARTKMPAGTVYVSDGTYEGYAYSITNQFTDKYDLFIYHHPGFDVYRVALLSPRLGGQLDMHGGHLYSDGTLCLTRDSGSGYRKMEQSYAKSALWTLGASLYLRGYGFQFNVGQDGDSRA